MKSIPIRIYEETKEEIEKLQSRLRLQDQKMSQQELIEKAIKYIISSEDDFIKFLTGKDAPLEKDPMWQLIHDCTDIKKTNVKKIDEYIYGG